MGGPPLISFQSRALSGRKQYILVAQSWHQSDVMSYVTVKGDRSNALSAYMFYLVLFILNDSPRLITRVIILVFQSTCVLLKKAYWSIVDLQRCVNFCHTAKCLSYTYIHFYILFRYGLTQNAGESSLCSTVRPCCSSVLSLIVCLC